MSKEFKEGDEVIYEGRKYKISHVTSKYALIGNDITSIIAHKRNLKHKEEQQQLGLFPDGIYIDELTGEDESWNMEYFAEGGIEKRKGSDLYCSCSNPILKMNSAYGNTFQVCTKCKKEKL